MSIRTRGAASIDRGKFRYGRERVGRRKPCGLLTEKIHRNDDFRTGSDIVITLDKSKRITLSKGAQEFFGVTGKNDTLTVYLGYDSINKCVCMCRPVDQEFPGVRTVKFGKFKFISARRFVERFQIDLTDAPLHYEYVGRQGPWFCFQLRGYDAPEPL